MIEAAGGKKHIIRKSLDAGELNKRMNLRTMLIWDENDGFELLSKIDVDKIEMRDVAVLPMLKFFVKANSLPTLAHSKLVKEFFAEKIQQFKPASYC